MKLSKMETHKGTQRRGEQQGKGTEGIQCRMYGTTRDRKGKGYR